MQNTTAKLLGRIITRKLARDLQDRQILPAKLARWGCHTREMRMGYSVALAYHVYEGYQRKTEALAVAIDLENTWNRVQFKRLVD